MKTVKVRKGIGQELVTATLYRTIRLFGVDGFGVTDCLDYPGMFVVTHLETGTKVPSTPGKTIEETIENAKLKASLAAKENKTTEAEIINSAINAMKKKLKLKKG